MAARKGKNKNHGPEFRAEAVAEALAGDPATVAKQRCISTRTLRRWVQQSKTSADMAASVQRKKSLIELDWAETAKAAMREMLRLMVETIRKAAIEDGPVPGGRIHEMAGAVKVVGELGIAKEMFGGRPAEDGRKVRAPAAPAGQAGDGEDIEAEGVTLN
jgi:transposase-like protein